MTSALLAVLVPGVIVRAYEAGVFHNVLQHCDGIDQEWLRAKTSAIVAKAKSEDPAIGKWTGYIFQRKEQGDIPTSRPTATNTSVNLSWNTEGIERGQLGLRFTFFLTLTQN
jgi:hypothetical protein